MLLAYNCVKKSKYDIWVFHKQGGEFIMDSLFDCGSIKRADLKLRTKYYGIKTKIYLIEHRHYVIQILNFLDMYDEIKKDFECSIRRIGDWVDLVKNEPSNIIEEVPPLSNIAHNNEGLFLTNETFQCLLISKFPDITLLKIEIQHGINLKVIITVGINTTVSEIEKLKNFIFELRNGFSDVIVQKSEFGKPLFNANVQLACTDNRFEFSKTDSSFWFDNVEKIYSGEIDKRQLRFFDDSTTKCYMDFSVWENENMNIRSNALLYDTIYLSFPLADHMETFLAQQHLSVADLEELVSRNKLVILLPNSESRYDTKTIERLYQVNKNCVVSKRGINALMAMFYCELENNYLLFWQENKDALEYLCKECIKSTDSKVKIIYDWLIWPIVAKQESYDLFTSYSPLTIPSIGANTLFDTIQKVAEKPNPNLDFELTVNSSAIHIATALKATYFPFAVKGSDGIAYSDVTVANIIGDILNAYQYTGNKQHFSIQKCGEILEKERTAIYLLKSDNAVSMKNILDYSQKYKTSQTLKQIISDLSKLDESQRIARVTEYNNQIAEIGKEHIGVGNISNYLLGAAGFVPVVGYFASGISILVQAFKDLGIHRHSVEKRIIGGKATIEDEVYLLDKLSRVAKITLQ